VGPNDKPSKDLHS